MTVPFSTEFEGPEESPGFLLWQVTNLWQRRQRAALKPLGLTHVQFVLLATAAWHAHDGKTLTQTHLAHLARVDVMMTSQVARTLEEKGLLLRRPHPLDTRANLLSVTEIGIDVAQRAVQAVEAVDRDFFAQLQEHPAHFAELLRRLLREEPPEG